WLDPAKDAPKRITTATQQAASVARKNSGHKYCPLPTMMGRAQAEYRFHVPATGCALSRAVSNLAATASLQAAPAAGFEPFLFLVGQIRSWNFGEIDQKLAGLSPANRAGSQKCSRVRPADHSRGFL